MRIKREEITLEYVKSLLSYSPNTGEFRWLEAAPKSVRGRVAGSIEKTNGYRYIRVGHNLILAHRLAWFYVHGLWPEKYLDHINGSRLDNRISNLRPATQRENMQNSRARSNRFGLPGVFQNGKRFGAQIALSGEKFHLGTFDTPEIAHQAYMAAKQKLHTFNPGVRLGPVYDDSRKKP